MSEPITNLIYDRTAADLTNGMKKGEWNPSDMNRVEEWCGYLATELTNAGYSITITTKTNWNWDDLRSAADMERVRNNIRLLRETFATAKSEITEVTPSAESFNWQKANNFEKVLSEINKYINSLESYFIHSGVARSGQRRLWQNRFRRLYHPKEYLESSGTQYIDTGVSGAVQVVLDLELTSVTPSGTNYSILWAENQGSPYECNGVRCNNYQDNVNIPFFQLGNGTTAEDNTKEAELNTRYTIAIDTNPDSYYLEVNGEMQVQGTSSGYPLTSYNLFLFANNGATTAKQFGKIKLYSCKIYKDNVLVRDFIPVTTTEPCLLDRVNGAFYYNQGTGTFS